jgi:hypothetical protein
MDLSILEVSDPRWMQTVRSQRHDIYQLPGYALVEAQRTNTIPEAILVTEDDKVLLIPYLLRKCDFLLPEASTTKQTAQVFDALSPYGYPGLWLSEAATHTPGFPERALQVVKQALYDKGVCSLFLRLHPILNQDIEALFAPDRFTANGRTVSIDLTLSEAQLWNHTKPDHRNKINRCRHLGLTARVVPVPDYLKFFVEIYQETMQRVEASAGYLEFDQAYFLQLDDVLDDMLHLCIVEYENQMISAGLYTECEGIVQAIFGGTLTDFLKLSPTTLETDYVRHWAKERGNQYLHLGGGLGGSQDRLYDFKSRFSKQSHSFLTLRLIINELQYDELVTQRAQALKVQPELLLQSTFFPAYRASIAALNKL